VTLQVPHQGVPSAVEDVVADTPRAAGADERHCRADFQEREVPSEAQPTGRSFEAHRVGESSAPPPRKGPRDEVEELPAHARKDRRRPKVPATPLSHMLQPAALD
jgi:hypothetical protein